ncbi:50S ribosomal protein L7/L12 [Patescibacteria group bacterium]|nr:50S ribosomal protein L7/L12 [Patescibacteria group bacterium]
MTDEPKKKKGAKKEVKVSGPAAKIIEQIEKLSVLELNDLVKALEDKFGVSAMPTMAAAPVAAGASTEAKDDTEKSIFTVVLTEAGAQKIQVIKAVRELNQNLGLKEAKELVDSAPKEVLVDVDKETADKARKGLEGAGAKVEMK